MGKYCWCQHPATFQRIMIKFIYNGDIHRRKKKQEKKKTVPGSPHILAAIFCRSRLGLSHRSSEMHYRIQNFALFDSNCRHNVRNVSKVTCRMLLAWSFAFW